MKMVPSHSIMSKGGGILLFRGEINGNPCRGWRGCLFLSFLLCFEWTEANTHHLTLWRQSSTIRGLLFLRFLPFCFSSFLFLHDMCDIAMVHHFKNRFFRLKNVFA